MPTKTREWADEIAPYLLEKIRETKNKHAKLADILVWAKAQGWAETCHVLANQQADAKRVAALEHVANVARACRSYECWIPDSEGVDALLESLDAAFARLDAIGRAEGLREAGTIVQRHDDPAADLTVSKIIARADAIEKGEA